MVKLDIYNYTKIQVNSIIISLKNQVKHLVISIRLYILFIQLNQIYGNLKRRGSTNSHNFRNCIDIYDVLLITRNFQIKRVRLYFNGYFTRENRYLIKLPQGFHLNPWSEEARIFKVVD